MDFHLSTEQQILRDSVRRFLDRSYGFTERMALVKDSPRPPPLDNWGVFAENGWLAAALPEACGGLGGSLVETALIAHEFGRALVIEPYLGCAVLAAQTLIAAASTQQLERLLPPMAAGERRIALAYSEPQSRGMAEPVKLRAERAPGGYALHGRKTLVLGGAEADLFIVTAAAPEGLALVLIDAKTPHLTRNVVALHDGSRAAQLAFDDVFVPGDAVLGQPAQALAALRHGLACGTAALCSELVGVMERAIEITADYVKVRQQFGVAIGSFQVLQHRLADMAAEMELARSMLFALIAATENGDAEARDRAVSQAKSLIGGAAKSVCAQAIQLHGGIGMTEECAIGHYYKRAAVADILLGAGDSHNALRAAALQQAFAASLSPAV